MTRFLLAAVLAALAFLPASIVAEPTCVPLAQAVSTDAGAFASTSLACVDGTDVTLASATCADAGAAVPEGALSKPVALGVRGCVLGSEGPADIRNVGPGMRDCFRDASGELWCCEYDRYGIKHCWEVISDIFYPWSLV